MRFPPQIWIKQYTLRFNLFFMNLIKPRFHMIVDDRYDRWDRCDRWKHSIAAIIAIAEVWFPYSRWDRSDRMTHTIAVIVTIVAIAVLWFPYDRWDRYTIVTIAAVAALVVSINFLRSLTIVHDHYNCSSVIVFSGEWKITKFVNVQSQLIGIQPFLTLLSSLFMTFCKVIKSLEL